MSGLTGSNIPASALTLLFFFIFQEHEGKSQPRKNVINCHINTKRDHATHYRLGMMTVAYCLLHSICCLICILIETIVCVGRWFLYVLVHVIINFCKCLWWTFMPINPFVLCSHTYFSCRCSYMLLLQCFWYSLSIFFICPLVTFCWGRFGG